MCVVFPVCRVISSLHSVSDGTELLDFISFIYEKGIIPNRMCSSEMLRSVDWELQAFRDNLSSPPSRIKKSNKKWDQ